MSAEQRVGQLVIWREVYQYSNVSQLLQFNLFNLTRVHISQDTREAFQHLSPPPPPPPAQQG